jgi:bifunctional UDP-N-acetylglucosamine pyrophosphorylase/glucosamine-1-phosphate N-acetyltransferase
MPKLAAIILAAGQGTRMKSSTPKMLHLLAGRPLIYYSVRAALGAGASDVVVVVGKGAKEVEDYLASTFGKAVRTASQAEQRGTGHAASMAMPVLGDVESTLVLYGDTPLLEIADLRALATALEGHPDASLALLTCVLDDPTGYGRVLRDEKGRVIAIREHRDLRNEKERAITEVNPGFYAARVPFLRDALGRLTPNNAQNELYLTDVVEAAGKKGGAIALPTQPTSLTGVNDRAQLASAEAVCTRTPNGGAFRCDCTVIRVDDGRSRPHVTLHSGVELAARRPSKPSPSTPGRYHRLTIEAGATIPPYSRHRASAPRARIGPFAHLRPRDYIGEEAHIGNFVETKKTVMHARPRRTTSPTSATVKSAKRPTSGPAPFFATTTVSPRTRPRSGAVSSLARTRSWWHP